MARLGIVKYSIVCRMLFGKSIKVINCFFPSRLNLLCENLPPNGFYTSDYFIDNLTMFPFYAAFVSNKRARMARLLMGGDGGIKIIAYLNSYGYHDQPFFRYCSDCARNDRFLYGETYWHRIHQLPEVLICPQHGTWLHNSFAPKFSYCAFHDAESVVDLTIVEKQTEINRDLTKMLFNISRTAWWILQNNPANLCSHILDVLETAFAGDRTRTYKMLNLDFLISSLRNDYSIHANQIEKLLLNSSFFRRNHAPIPIVYLLIATLWCNLKLDSGDANNRSLSETTAKHLNISSGISTGQMFRSAAFEEKLSQYRSDWLAIAEQNPNEGRSFLKKVYGHPYHWLRLNDCNWLRQHLPLIREFRSYCVNWESRDQLYLEKINVAIRQIYAVQPPRRISLYEVEKTCGLSKRIGPNLDKLPMTHNLLLRTLESREKFQIRRLNYIAESYIHEKCIPSRNQLIYRSGLSKFMQKPGFAEAIDIALTRIRTETEHLLMLK